MKASVFLVKGIDTPLCLMVKARESVGRRAKPMVRPRKFAYPQKTCFVNKKIIGGTISNGFWFIKQKNFVLENDHWMRTSMMVYHTLAYALYGGSR